MTHWWVSFETWAPDGDVWHVSPSTWVDAVDVQEAEQVARRKLRDQVHAGLLMTTCVPFSEEDYQKEMTRLREYRKRQGWDPSHMN